MPRRIGIVYKKNSPEAADCSKRAAQHLAALGLEVSLDEEGLSRADLVVVLGGDGTLIHAARCLNGRLAPILGVNMGSLGFLTEVPQAELFPALHHVLSGQAEVSERMKLRVHVHRGQGAGEQRLVDDEVLNDVVLAKGTLARMTEFEATAAGHFVTRYRADGVIVSTPTGSTAYSLAANGPILYPSMRGVILAPICPHTLTQRPIVLPDDQLVTIELVSESQVFITLDGQTGEELKPGDRVQIKQSHNRVLVVRNPHIDYFGILRAKLKWGEP
ncbi:MAG TPA: NAD(+)/NADH kinase [Anaeromyxobacteraceae bacterium]|nr:NAD(+)/NADH kinase [Anaeromyxobacteraceae bacterium]